MWESKQWTGFHGNSLDTDLKLRISQPISDLKLRISQPIKNIIVIVEGCPMDSPNQHTQKSW